MMTVKCHFCERGLSSGYSMHRINEKGVPGIWACREHFSQGDWPRDQVVTDIIDIVEKAKVA